MRCVCVCSTHVFVFCFLWECVGCTRGHSKPWAFLFFHILQGTRNNCKSRCVTGTDLGPVPGSSLPAKHFTKNTLSRRATFTVMILSYLWRAKSLSYLYIGSTTAASMATNTSGWLLGPEESAELWKRRVPIRRNPSIMMRDRQHISKLLMSLFLVKGLPRLSAFMPGWQKTLSRFPSSYLYSKLSCSIINQLTNARALTAPYLIHFAVQNAHLQSFNCARGNNLLFVITFSPSVYCTAVRLGRKTYWRKLIPQPSCWSWAGCTLPAAPGVSAKQQNKS